MTTSPDSRSPDRVRQLVHDLRESLYVMGMGLELIKTVRNDDAEFDNIWLMIERERAKAIQVARQMSGAAGDNPSHAVLPGPVAQSDRVATFSPSEQAAESP